MLTLEIKTCSICGEDKELSEYYFQNKKKANGDEYVYYQPYCKECTKNKSSNWIRDNHEKHLKAKNKYNKSKKGRNSRNKYNVVYLKDGRYLQWQRENKEVVNSYSKNRNKHKSHDISNEELDELYEYCNSSCMYCGLSEEKHKELYSQVLHKDHAYNNGSNGIDNCILACKSCNSSKRDENWDIWYTPDNPKFTEERYVRIKERLDLFK